jgi:dTDP-glucose 4,6-dehydratase
MTIMVTGGAGFIGSNFVLNWLSKNDEKVINVDKLTYAGNLQNLKAVENNSNHLFVKEDILNKDIISKLIKDYNPRYIVNFAAESHVDRSIHEPDQFIQTNIVGTQNLLESVRIFWDNLSNKEKNNFRFLHVSTDEVYGSLGPNEASFTETNRYKPNSPYSASKAASDHLVRAYYKTYEIPVLTTNCSNNYGPFQFPEKLIPLVLLNALSGKEIPIYGDGQQIRDWLFVSDHCNAINTVLEAGKVGEIYNVGGLNEKTNIEIVNLLCEILDNTIPKANSTSYKSQITYVRDRAGHDKRYAINASKIEKELNWRPTETFETGIKKTVDWYLNNQNWVKNITSGDYLTWIARNYS